MKLRFLSEILLAALISVAPVGCLAENKIVLGPSELIAKADELDGQIVTVRGHFTFGFEDRNIWNSAESRRKWRERECVSLVNYGRLDTWTQYSGKEVFLEAVVRKDADESGKIIRLGACNKIALELIEGKPPQVVQPDPSK